MIEGGTVQDGLTITCLHLVREDRRRRFGLADDHARLVNGLPLVDQAQTVFGHVDEEVARAEIGREPAPPFHIGDEIGLQAGRGGTAAQGRHRLGVEDPARRQALLLLEGRDGRRQPLVIRGLVAGRRIDVEAGADERHARIAHADPQRRPARDADHGRRRPARGAQLREPGLQRPVPCMRGIVGPERGAGIVCRLRGPRGPRRLRADRASE